MTWWVLVLWDIYMTQCLLAAHGANLPLLLMRLDRKLIFPYSCGSLLLRQPGETPWLAKAAFSPLSS